MSAHDRLPLSDGHAIPQLGFGTYKIPDADAARAVDIALAEGYRHVDTAALYGNEHGVGEAVQRSGLARDDVFVTSKVWNDDHGYDETLRAFDRSLGLLGLEFLDLYLIHWPVPSEDRYVDTWRALIRLKEEGRTRSIGVSNFHAHHIERIVGETGVVPVVNQVELSPWLQQRDLRDYHAEHDIVTEAWSPLARGRAPRDAVLTGIGRKHGVSPAQVAIRWHLQEGNVVIPKSATPARIQENADVYGFTLDETDLAAIRALDEGSRTGRDPDDD